MKPYSPVLLCTSIVLRTAVVLSTMAGINIPILATSEAVTKTTVSVVSKWPGYAAHGISGCQRAVELDGPLFNPSANRWSDGSGSMELLAACCRRERERG